MSPRDVFFFPSPFYQEKKKKFCSLRAVECFNLQERRNGHWLQKNVGQQDKFVAPLISSLQGEGKFQQTKGSYNWGQFPIT